MQGRKKTGPIARPGKSISLLERWKIEIGGPLGKHTVVLLVIIISSQKQFFKKLKTELQSHIIDHVQLSKLFFFLHTVHFTQIVKGSLYCITNLQTNPGNDKGGY